MLSDPVDVCGNELGRVEDRRLGGWIFSGTKSLLRRQRNGLGR